jgi:hypothetical protein
MPGIRTTVMLLAMAAFVSASTIFQSAPIEQDYVPFAYDGTPGRPSPGNFEGAQITFGGTDRLLASLAATLYLNDGARLTAPPDVCSGEAI